MIKLQLVDSSILGMRIDQVCREACLIAKQTNRSVAFIFNDKAMKAEPNSNPDEMEEYYWSCKKTR